MERSKMVKNEFVLATVVGDNINIMKTTLNFNSYQGFKSMDTQKHGNKEKLLIKKASL